MSALIIIVATVAVVGAAVLVALQVRQDRRAQYLVPPPRVATGPTVRLTCCNAPDVPRGAAYCIRCGRPVQP